MSDLAPSNETNWPPQVSLIHSNLFNYVDLLLVFLHLSSPNTSSHNPNLYNFYYWAVASFIEGYYFTFSICIFHLPHHSQWKCSLISLVLHFFFSSSFLFYIKFYSFLSKFNFYFYLFILWLIFFFSFLFINPIDSLIHYLYLVFHTNILRQPYLSKLWYDKHI